MLNNTVYYAAGAYPKILLCCVMATSAVQSSAGDVFTNWNMSDAVIKTPANVFGFVYSPSVSNAKSEARRKNLAKLDEIAALRANWNGYGALPFSPGLLKTAREVISALTVQPEVFPTADDSIQIEYDGPKGSYLEVQITEDAQFEVLHIDRDGHEETLHVDAGADALNQLVRKFYGSELS